MNYKLYPLLIFTFLASVACSSKMGVGEVIVKSDTILKFHNYGDLWKIQNNASTIEVVSCSSTHFCMEVSDAGFNILIEDENIKLSAITTLVMTSFEKSQVWTLIDGNDREDQANSFNVEFKMLDYEALLNCRKIVADFDSNQEVHELLELDC